MGETRHGTYITNNLWWMAFAIFFPAFFALVVVSMKPAMLSGYSSLRLAMAVPGVRVVTIDVAGCPTVRQRRSACSRSRPISAVLKTPLVFWLVSCKILGFLLAEPMKNGSAQFVAGIATNQSSRTSALIWFWIIFPSAALVPRIQHMCSLPETWLPSAGQNSDEKPGCL